MIDVKNVVISSVGENMNKKVFYLTSYFHPSLIIGDRTRQGENGQQASVTARFSEPSLQDLAKLAKEGLLQSRISDRAVAMVLTNKLACYISIGKQQEQPLPGETVIVAQLVNERGGPFRPKPEDRERLTMEDIVNMKLQLALYMIEIMDVAPPLIGKQEAAK